MTDTHDLKACPWCDSNADLMRGRGYSIACSGGVHDCGVAPETAEFSTLQEAVEAWNHRSTPKAEPGEVEAVARELCKLEMNRRGLLWDPDLYDKTVDEWWPRFEVDAKAVLSSIRPGRDRYREALEEIHGIAVTANELARDEDETWLADIANRASAALLGEGQEDG